ncbi:MAG: hypothetical protein ACK438_07060 [Flavobacteriales bacterium]|jgi:hypothetical protein
MKKISFLTLLLVSVSLLIPKYGKNCGGNYMYYNMLFDRDLVFSDGKALSSYNLWNYNSSLYGSYSIQLQNATEWAEFLENKYVSADLIPIIYRETSFTTLAKETKNLRSNRISEKDISMKETLFINYLELALAVEKHLKGYEADPWGYGEEEIKKDPLEYTRLVDKANQMLAVNQHTMIKERIGFQLIKLHRYEENYREVLTIFENNFSNTNSFIGYWAMDHYAGALSKLGRKAEANYFFSKVYVNSPSRRVSAYSSIKINSEKEMDDVKKICSTTDEKLALHFIRGVETKVLSLGDIEYIINNGGNHEYARVLMSYEINKLERILLKYPSPYFEDNKNETKEALIYLKQLIELNNKIIAVDDASKYWHLSLAYLYYLNNDYTNSKNILENHIPNSTDLKIQHTVLEILNYIASKEELTVMDENILGHKLYEINKNKETISSITTSKKYPDVQPDYYVENYRKGYEDYNTINEYIFKLIYSKVKNKNAFKELIFNGNTIQNDLFRRDFPKWNEVEQEGKKLSIEYLDQLLAAFETTEKTKLTDFAARYYFEFKKNYDFNYEGYYGVGNVYFNLEAYYDIKYVLLEMKATLLMRNPNRLKEAIVIFEQLPEAFNNASNMYKNPFEMSARNIRFNEETDVQSILEENSFTKLKLAKQLLVHFEKANATNSALDYFHLGVAYYNISYYSNMWGFLAYYRCTFEPNGFVDNSIALKFLDKALAIGLKNRELEAKAHFMGARCEQNLFTQRYGSIGGNTENGRYFDDFMTEINQAGFQKNFATLKKSYSNSEFYKDIISECSYFSYYQN